MGNNIGNKKKTSAEKALEILLEKDAIRDQLYKYCRAMDRIDNELAYSIFAEDSHVNYGFSFPSGTGHEFVDQVSEQHSGMVATQHFISNILIEVNGDRAASESYMCAGLKNAAKRKDGSDATFTIQARIRYIDLWEKRDGKWLIVDRVVGGDNTMSIVPKMDFENYNTTRDRNDVSYKFFEAIHADNSK